MAEVLHRQPIPQEMTTPPYGAVVTVYEDHTTLDLPYVQQTITILHGEMVKVGIKPFGEGRMCLEVTRDKA